MIQNKCSHTHYVTKFLVNLHGSEGSYEEAMLGIFIFHVNKVSYFEFVHYNEIKEEIQAIFCYLDKHQNHS